MKLTAEPFPRLSVVRTLKTKALAHLGPFRSKKAADLVVSALWDATMIRRCSSRPVKAVCPGPNGCFALPMRWEPDPIEYQRVVDQIVDGISHRSDLLLQPLVDRMEQLSSSSGTKRPAGPGTVSRRLARAIETSRTWVALEGLGVCEMEGEDGSHVVVDHGRLVCTWRAGSKPPLRPAPEATDEAGNDVPNSVETAEEARLIWNWIKSTPLRLVDATGTLAMPSCPVVHLGTWSGR